MIDPIALDEKMYIYETRLKFYQAHPSFPIINSYLYVVYIIYISNNVDIDDFLKKKKKNISTFKRDLLNSNLFEFFLSSIGKLESKKWAVVNLNEIN